MSETRRSNQKHRTRKELLSVAARLMKEGRRPSVAEVAEEAKISRATAYRYFPSQDALLAEAPLDEAVPEAQNVFAGDPSTDPEERIDRAEKVLHEMVQANEAQLRVMLARTLDLPGRQRTQDGVPRRQNRRGALIAAALEPARQQFDAATYEMLQASLAPFFGTESMVVFTDVLQLSPRKAREIKSWAIRALVRAALERSRSSKRARPARRKAPRQRRSS